MRATLTHTLKSRTYERADKLLTGNNRKVLAQIPAGNLGCWEMDVDHEDRSILRVGRRNIAAGGAQLFEHELDDLPGVRDRFVSRVSARVGIRERRNDDVEPSFRFRLQDDAVAQAQIGHIIAFGTCIDARWIENAVESVARPICWLRTSSRCRLLPKKQGFVPCSIT